MKTWRWMLVFLTAGAFASACTVKTKKSDDETGGGGSVSTSSSSSSSGTTSSSSSSSSSGTSSSSSSSSGDCPASVNEDPACNGCMQANCCSVVENTITVCNACSDPNNCPECSQAFSSMVECATTAQCGDCQYPLCNTQLALWFFQDTAACLNQNCCTELEACEADGACKACLLGQGTGCDSDTLFLAYGTCRDTNCSGE